jgi:hypothetical protein
MLVTDGMNSRREAYFSREPSSSISLKCGIDIQVNPEAAAGLREGEKILSSLSPKYLG